MQVSQPIVVRRSSAPLSTCKNWKRKIELVCWLVAPACNEDAATRQDFRPFFGVLAKFFAEFYRRNAMPGSVLVVRLQTIKLELAEYRTTADRWRRQVTETRRLSETYRRLWQPILDLNPRVDRVSIVLHLLTSWACRKDLFWDNDQWNQQNLINKQSQMGTQVSLSPQSLSGILHEAHRIDGSKSLSIDFSSSRQSSFNRTIASTN
jgi:hypothetical protein